MATLNFTEAFEQDVQRLVGFLEQSHPEDAVGLVELMIEALRILQDHPEIGRPHRYKQRELVISRGKSGYLCLYKFNPLTDQVDILRIRHQRESGYKSL
jgi:plasmid stabilization system protein ParE